LKDVRVRADAKAIDAGGTTISPPALITFDERRQPEVFFEANPRQKRLTEYVYGLPMGKPFIWVVDCARASDYTPMTGDAAGNELCAVAGRRGAVPVVHERISKLFEIEEDQLARVLDSRASPELYSAQAARMRAAHVPSGLGPLVESLPRGSVFFYSSSDRTSAYIKDYAKLPEVASRGLRWMTSLPQEAPFYFAAPSLNSVRKSNRYDIRRLAFGDDIVTLLDRHARDVVVLSLKGDMEVLSESTRERLARVGIDLARLDRHGSFAAVLDANVPVAFEMADDRRVVLSSGALRERGIERVESAGRELGDESKVIVRGKNVSNNKRGMNIVVLKPGSDPLRFSIDTHNTERLYSDVYEATERQ
jgi:hypothetical protein